MRVAYLTNNPNPNSTGRILQSWVQLAAVAGIEPCVIAQAEGRLPQWVRDQSVDCLIDPMPWPDRRRLFAFAHHLWRARRWARRHGVQLVHCNEHNVYPFGAALARALGVPIVCHVRFRLTAGFARWAFSHRRAPDALLWTSRQQQRDSADAVAALVPDHRQHLVPLGIDVNAFGQRTETGRTLRRTLGIDDGAIVLGTASALRPIKRIHEFVEIVERLARRDRRVIGLIAGDALAGDEDYRQSIIDRIAATGLGDRLRGIGHLDDVEPFMHAIDLFVSASEYETFGNSVLEAMACGKPVAAYAGGSVAEVAGEAGLIADTGDLPALTAHCTRLVDGADLRRQLGEAARRRVAECFNPIDAFGRLIDVYGSLTPRRAAA